MTRWRPRTPRRCCTARSAPCSPRPRTRRSGWARRCAATTPQAPRRTATGTTPGARQELVDRLGADAAAVLAALEGRELDGALSEAAELLAAVAGQDLCQGPRRAFHDRSARGQGPGPVHCGPRRPPRPQKHGETLRRLQGPHRGGPRLRTDHRHRSHPSQHRRRPTRTRTHQRPPQHRRHRRHRRGRRHRRHRAARTPTPPRTAEGADTADTAEGGGVVEEFAGRAHGSMATARTAAASSRGCFSRAASTRGAAPSLRPRRGAASPRTDSTSICSAAPSPAPRGRPSPSEPAATARARPRSARPATGARCAATAPTPPGAAPCASAPTRPCSPRRAPASGTPHGETTTAPCAPKSNAS